MGKRTVLAPALLAAATLSATAAFADCRCRANGGFYALGEVTCIRTAAGERLARCEMALNNTSWKVVAESCPAAMRSLPRESTAIAARLHRGAGD